MTTERNEYVIVIVDYEPMPSQGTSVDSVFNELSSFNNKVRQVADTLGGTVVDVVGSASICMWHITSDVATLVTEFAGAISSNGDDARVCIGIARGYCIIKVENSRVQELLGAAVLKASRICRPLNTGKATIVIDATAYDLFATNGISSILPRAKKR